MQYVIISDSHGNSSAIEEVLYCHPNRDVIFLGDGIRDIERTESLYAGISFLRVAGNNDLFSLNAPKSITVPMGKHTLFCTHGHNYGVREGTDLIRHYAAASGCSAALFGHTHVPVNRTEEGILLLNPGSLGYGGTYALLTEKDGRLSAELKSL